MTAAPDAPTVNVAAATFPTLSEEEMKLLRPLASERRFADGQVIFKAGDADIDLFVVQSGQIDILNPTDDNRLIATHGPRAFAGDIDLLTRRPVIVTAVAHGETVLLAVPGSMMRTLLIRVPKLGEKMLNAFTLRRQALTETGIVGLRLVGPGRCRETNMVREFLHKNFVPFTWYDPEQPNGREVFEELGSPRVQPVVDCGGGKVLSNPSLVDLAAEVGVWRQCPDQTVDLAVIGAGPAGMTAAVYAASEGMSTIVVDRFGPGGQAGGSSKIENFIGFPAGLSGTELATRGVLQMLKFGAKMVAPVVVEKIEPAREPGQYHLLHLDCRSTIRAKVVLVATGVNWRRLDADGVARFESTGVHHACTSVESALYDRCHVAVVGAGNSAGQAAMYMAECCPDRTVHMIIRNKLGPGMSDYLAQRIRAAPNVTLHEGREVAGVTGDGGRIARARLKTRDGDSAEELDVNAVFVFIGADPQASCLPDAAARDDHGYVLTGVDALRSGRWPLDTRDPLPLETTIPGVLAAGDLRAGSTKRVGFAVGDGSMAVTSAHRLATAFAQHAHA